MKAVKAFFITLAVVLAICFAFLFARSGRMREAAGDLSEKAESEIKQETVSIASKPLMPVIENAISSQLQSRGMSKEEADGIVSSVTEKDKAKLTEIAGNHFNAILETAWYIDAGDTENLTESLQKELSAEELAELTAIIYKYVPEEYLQK